MIQRGKLHFIVQDLKPNAPWKHTGSVSAYLVKVALFEAYLLAHPTRGKEL